MSIEFFPNVPQEEWIWKFYFIPLIDIMAAASLTFALSVPKSLSFPLKSAIMY